MSSTDAAAAGAATENSAAAESQPRHQLYYFDIAGRGEGLRLALSHAKIPFDDVRVAFGDWAALKPTLKYGQLPMLKTPDGEELCQSAAIMRYIGRLAPGPVLYPTEDLVKCALIDSVMDNDGDIAAGISCFRYGHRYGFGHLSDEVKQEAAKSLMETVFPVRLGQFERLLEQSSTPWLADTPGPSVADFFCAGRFQAIEDGAELYEQNSAALKGFISKNFPLLTKFLKDFAEIPSNVAYYEARKPAVVEE